MGFMRVGQYSGVRYDESTVQHGTEQCRDKAVGHELGTKCKLVSETWVEFFVSTM